MGQQEDAYDPPAILQPLSTRVSSSDSLPPSYPAQSAYQEQPSYPAQPAYQAQPSYPAQPAYQAQPSYPTQPAYQEQPSYAVAPQPWGPSPYVYPTYHQGVPPLAPYDPATPFSSWLATAECTLHSYPAEQKMRQLWTALPTEVQLWLRLKCLHEQSDWDAAKPIMLNLMRHTEVQRRPVDLFKRRQRPGESYAQFAMALQTILDACFRNRVSADVQEELLCAAFIAGIYPPTLQGKLESLGHTGIVELIRAATESAHSTPRPDQPQRLKPRYAANPLPRNPRPERAGQGKSRNNPVYTLRSGTCPVIKATIRSRRCRFLVVTGAAISIIKPTMVPENWIDRVDRNHTIDMAMTTVLQLHLCSLQGI